MIWHLEPWQQALIDAIGRGQRVMVVAPRHYGKGVFLAGLTTALDKLPQEGRGDPTQRAENSSSGEPHV